MMTTKTLNLRDRDDLAYLKAMVDMAPTLVARRDTGGALTEEWKAIITGLIDLALKDERLRRAAKTAVEAMVVTTDGNYAVEWGALAEKGWYLFTAIDYQQLLNAYVEASIRAGGEADADD